MHRRIRRAYTTFVEQGYTKLATISSHSQLDLIIAKATSPNDLPLPEHCVWELAIIFSSSPSLSRRFALSFARRFGQTRCWRVALKCLLLLHLLLRTLPSNHPFPSDILSARANALISFNPCHFRDASSSYSEDYTLFIQSYAHLIDEVLNCYDSISKEDYSIAKEDYTPLYTSSPLSPGSTFEERLSEAGQALELVQQLQGLMDRAMECVPAGPAARSFIIRSAMKQIARESFMSYLAARQGLAVVLDSILQMPYRSCIDGLALYKRAAEQAVRLGEFHQRCKGMGFCAQYAYPLVDKIPKIQVVMLETFVEQVWQLTESSSASSPVNSEHSPAVEEQGSGTLGTAKEMVWQLTESSSASSPIYSVHSPAVEERGSGALGTGKEIVISDKWEKFEEESEEGEEEKQLIRSEDGETSWEVLLDASLKWPWSDSEHSRAMEKLEQRRRTEFGKGEG